MPRAVAASTSIFDGVIDCAEMKRRSELAAITPASI
jgi:hypothetical protein